MSSGRSIRAARKAHGRNRLNQSAPTSAVLEAMRGHMRDARRTRPESSATGRRMAQTKGK